MKNKKLYNVIFPIWALWIFPPFIILAIIGNYIIDSLVLVACYYIFKLKNTDFSLKSFYKKTIVKVWIWGFVADILGSILLFYVFTTNRFRIPNDIRYAVMYGGPFTNPWALFAVGCCMVLTSALIFIFNYYIVFQKIALPIKTKRYISIFIAIITCPWFYLIPTNWFYV